MNGCSKLGGGGGAVHTVCKRGNAQANAYFAMMSSITEFITLGGGGGNSSRKIVVVFAIILCDPSPKCRAESKDRRKY